MVKKNISIFWHRRDLRLHDNAGLYHALKEEQQVQPIFIFDRHILDALENRQDARVSFIHEQLIQLDKVYRQYGCSLKIFDATPLAVFQQLCATYQLTAVYTNRDYEPYAQQRDKTVYEFLKGQNIKFTGYKDQVIFEKNEVVKNDGKPYTVFTPYARKWREKLDDFYTRSYPVEKYVSRLVQDTSNQVPVLEKIGFKKTTIVFPPAEINHQQVQQYATTRDIPSIKGTSRLGVHLRFGTISIRELLYQTQQHTKYVNELIWRDFYQMILFHYPHTVSSAFKPAYDHIQWRNNEKEFELWCAGLTGYPLVDAGMRELNVTGYMHNRVRMVTASFLTKHLLIDWRWGEAYFARKLLDFELASNVGGWQWAAGCGCDAAPYFRVFNPNLQTQKFDPDLKYVQKWVPEYGTAQYPQPIVEHTFARNRAITTFKKALNEK